MKHLLPPLFVFLLAFASPAPPAAADVNVPALRASIVSVEVVLQGEDYRSPWRTPNPSGTGGSGFFIGDGRIMTNAHVVSDAKIIRLKRPDRPDRFPARVLYYAHDCDLAMITVDDPTFFEGMVPLDFGELPALRSQVTAVGYPIGGRKLSITEGVVSRIELHDYVHTGSDRHLAIQVDAAINPGNSGGPVLQDDRVVGVAFQTQFFSQNIGYMIPIPVVRHFLKDLEDGRYDGYPLLGILTWNLENEALRSWLKIPDGETGVAILKALPHSSVDGLVRKNDVLLAVDEYRVENDGTVKVDDEFLELAYVIQEKQTGDTVNLRVRRDGELMEIPVVLKKWDVMMPPGTTYGQRPEYVVLGGYVFVPLTSNYVSVAGWRNPLGYWLNEFYRSLYEDRPGQEQLVVLSRVLADDSNRYRDYSNVVVKSLNGTPPRDFHHFVSMLDAADQAVIEFEGVNVLPLVIQKKVVDAVQDRILEKYGISKARYLAEED